MSWDEEILHITQEKWLELSNDKYPHVGEIRYDRIIEMISQDWKCAEKFVWWKIYILVSRLDLECEYVMELFDRMVCVTNEKSAEIESRYEMEINNIINSNNLTNNNNNNNNGNENKNENEKMDVLDDNNNSDIDNSEAEIRARKARNQARIAQRRAEARAKKKTRERELVKWECISFLKENMFDILLKENGQQKLSKLSKDTIYRIVVDIVRLYELEVYDASLDMLIKVQELDDETKDALFRRLDQQVCLYGMGIINLLVTRDTSIHEIIMWTQHKNFDQIRDCHLRPIIRYDAEHFYPILTYTLDHINEDNSSILGRYLDLLRPDQTIDMLTKIFDRYPDVSTDRTSVSPKHIERYKVENICIYKIFDMMLECGRYYRQWLSMEDKRIRREKYEINDDTLETILDLVCLDSIKMDKETNYRSYVWYLPYIFDKKLKWNTAVKLGYLYKELMFDIDRNYNSDTEERRNRKRVDFIRECIEGIGEALYDRDTLNDRNTERFMNVLHNRVRDHVQYLGEDDIPDSPKTLCVFGWINILLKAPLSLERRIELLNRCTPLQPPEFCYDSVPPKDWTDFFNKLNQEGDEALDIFTSSITEWLTKDKHTYGTLLDGKVVSHWSLILSKTDGDLAMLSFSASQWDSMMTNYDGRLWMYLKHPLYKEAILTGHYNNILTKYKDSWQLVYLCFRMWLPLDQIELFMNERRENKNDKKLLDSQVIKQIIRGWIGEEVFDQFDELFMIMKEWYIQSNYNEYEKLLSFVYQWRFLSTLIKHGKDITSKFIDINKTRQYKLINTNSYIAAIYIHCIFRKMFDSEMIIDWFFYLFDSNNQSVCRELHTAIQNGTMCYTSNLDWFEDFLRFDNMNIDENVQKLKTFNFLVDMQSLCSNESVHDMFERIRREWEYDKLEEYKEHVLSQALKNILNIDNLRLNSTNGIKTEVTTILRRLGVLKSRGYYDQLDVLIKEMREVMLIYFEHEDDSDGSELAIQQHILDVEDNANESTRLQEFGYNQKIWSECLSIKLMTNKRRTFEELFDHQKEQLERISNEIFDLNIDQDFDFIDFWNDITDKNVLNAKKGDIMNILDQLEKDVRYSDQAKRMKKNIRNLFDQRMQPLIKTWKSFRLLVNSKFWDMMKTCSETIPGCYAPNGAHAEKVLIDGLRIDSSIISAYDQKGNECENAEVRFLDVGMFVDPIHSNLYGVESDEMWAYFWKYLLESELVPAILLVEGAPAFKLLNEYIETVELLLKTTSIRDVIFKDVYYDTSLKDYSWGAPDKRQILKLTRNSFDDITFDHIRTEEEKKKEEEEKKGEIKTKESTLAEYMNCVPLWQQLNKNQQSILIGQAKSGSIEINIKRFNKRNKSQFTSTEIEELVVIMISKLHEDADDDANDIA